MTTINILIYTDYKDFEDIDDGGDLRPTKLKELLQTKRMGFAEFKVTVVDRYEAFFKKSSPEPRQLNKLTRDLLDRFDEIWFFGWYQSNVEQEFAENYGGRENELDEDEERELERWMAWGGVLMSGDHSVYKPFGSEKDPRDTFLCLGRAIGYRVPRAGKLREWQGPPTNLADDSFNTLVKTGLPGEQGDPLPQIIRLTRSEANGAPHPIFLGERRTIDVLPDHGHEGLIVMPDLDSKWPPFDEEDESKKLKPEFVAFGCDKRTCKASPVLALYDGDKSGVGRIAADSSWHHYVNVNLKGFTDTGQDSTLDLLAQLFQNLALYLAPRGIRQQMSRDMIAWLAQQSDLKEERGNDPEVIGEIALRHLLAITTRYEREELFQLASNRQRDANAQPFSFSSLPSERSLLPSQNQVLGSIINRYYREASAQPDPNVGASFGINASEDLMAAGLTDAFDAQREWLVKALTQITSLNLNVIEQEHPAPE